MTAGVIDLSGYDDRRRPRARRCKGCGGSGHDVRVCLDPIVRARRARDKAALTRDRAAEYLRQAEAELAPLEAELTSLLDHEAKHGPLPDPRVVPFRRREAWMVDEGSEGDG